MIVSQTWAVPAPCEGYRISLDLARTYPLRNWFLESKRPIFKGDTELSWARAIASTKRVKLKLSIKELRYATGMHRLSGWTRVFAP